MADRIWSVSELMGSLRGRAEASGLPIIDLGQGTPVDPTPDVARRALAEASDWPGYPPAHGTAALRSSYSDWAGRRWGAVVDPRDVVVTAGSKEFIATAPWLLGLGPGDLVVIPELAYPTYAAGAQAAGCRVVAADSLTALGPQNPALVWINTPGNPTGKVLPAEHLAKVIAWARERDAVVISDECYVELTEEGSPAPSVLSPEVNGGSHRNVLAVHSMSKSANMAGYRVGFAAGDGELVARLLRRRRDCGLIAAGPAQAAARAALDDDEHVRKAQQLYSERRTVLRDGLTAAGFRIEDSQAGLFVWATAGLPDSATVAAMADVGILAAPGGFYGPKGAQHVRLSLTAPLESLREARRRLATVRI
jgi:succinyldiaminopimelate transaminase